jgi:hypothetical protein
MSHVVVRSGLLTVLILAAVLGVLALGWREHRMGQFAQLKKGFNHPVQEAPSPRPGGQDAIHLERSSLVDSNEPEFLTATLLPGRGMNVLQITAYLPGKGKVNLLASPSLNEAAQRMNGIGSDWAGAESLAMGAALEIPWAGRISGATSVDGKNLATMWRDAHLILPIDTGDSFGAGAGAAAGGLLLKQPSSTAGVSVMPDGGQAQATFAANDFDGQWPSQTEISTSFELSGKSIEMKVVAKNTGSTAEPIGIGWHPRFAILNQHRGQMMLRLPQADRIEVKDRQTGQLTGKLLPVAGTEYDFTALTGARLGTLNLDDTFVHLQQGLMDNGPVAELRDPENGYGLRITALSRAIKAYRVYAPLDGSFLSIDPQFNYDDPFGREWAKDEDTGMVVLEPGQSAQWRIRLEIFSLNADHHL